VPEKIRNRSIQNQMTFMRCCSAWQDSTARLHGSFQRTVQQKDLRKRNKIIVANKVSTKKKSSFSDYTCDPKPNTSKGRKSKL